MSHRHQAQLSALIVEHARDYAIFTLDGAGLIVSWSPGAEHVFGYPAADAIGMDFARLFTPADQEAGMPARELAKAVEHGRAEDTRWHLCASGERFWANGITTVIEDPEIGGFLKIARDETAAKNAEEQRVLLLNELNHRIKNTLATVQSIAEQTLRAGGVETATRTTLIDRLMALSDAHNVLTEKSWAGADLLAIVEGAVAPYRHPGRDPITLDGPPVRLSPQQAVAVALALHELATIAVKYGGLSTPDGVVTVTWNLAWDEVGARHLVLLWAEQGGPPVAPPSRQGFGTRLLARTFGDSGGRTKLDFAPTGVRCVIELPLSTSEETPPP